MDPMATKELYHCAFISYLIRIGTPAGASQVEWSVGFGISSGLCVDDLCDANWGTRDWKNISCKTKKTKTICDAGILKKIFTLTTQNKVFLSTSNYRKLSFIIKLY